MRETPKMEQMFEYYYMLGEDRTIAQVSEHFNLSRQTISKYSKQFNWRERVYERDTKILNELRKENNNDIKATMNSYRKVIKASVADYINRLKSNKIKVESVKDFVKLVELEMKICGFQAQEFDRQLEEKAFGLSKETQQTISEITEALEEQVNTTEEQINNNEEDVNDSIIENSGGEITNE